MKKIENEINKETFENYVNSLIVEKYVFEKEITLKNVTKLRDSSRVCFLENKVKYLNCLELLGNEKVIENEKIELRKKLEIFLNRSIKYLSIYNVVKELLLEIRKNEKEKLEKEKLEKEKLENEKIENVEN